MEFVTTSLDALLQRATNSKNQNVDVAAVEAFCALMNKEKDGPHIGAKLIASRMHSNNESEVLQTLNVLDTCMVRCGGPFQAEVGKFRFLNEMIKLVSPKYLGAKTPLSVRQKVLQLMYVWSLDYPKETKIKEAYDMLRKQGVIKEVPSLSVSGDGVTAPRKAVNSVFQDEEKSKLLQYLLQSKNPEDLQAANRLIKNMVKEDDKRSELKSKRTSELESAHNNIRLLNEMLDSYKPGLSSPDELDLIHELHQSCVRLKPNIVRMSSETYPTEELLNNVIQVNEELNAVFEKYKQIIVDRILESQSNDLSLLDLESGEINPADSILKLDETVETATTVSDIDVLNDIFNTANVPEPVMSATDILVPLAASNRTKEIDPEPNNIIKKIPTPPTNKLKAFDELDVLSEHLLKENLPVDSKFRTADKISMNTLSKQSETLNSLINRNETVNHALSLDLNYLIGKTNEDSHVNVDDKRNGDDVLVDISDDKLLGSETNGTKTKDDDELLHDDRISKREETVAVSEIKSEVKLSDLCVKLEDIRPGSVPPMTVLEDKSGIGVTLHFAKDRPKENVSVVVITTVSKRELPLSNYLFQAVVPKGCRLRLQPPSSADLPAYNPFLPPAAITQIMLIANPENLQVSLKFILSYTMDNETITEMGEVEKLPVN